MLKLHLSLDAHRPTDISHVVPPASESFVLTDNDVRDITQRLDRIDGSSRRHGATAAGAKAASEPVAVESLKLANERRQSVTRLAVRRMLSMWQVGERWHALYGLPLLILADSLPTSMTLPMLRAEAEDLLKRSGLIPEGVEVTPRYVLCPLDSVLAATGYRMPEKIRALGLSDDMEAPGTPEWGTDLGEGPAPQQMGVRYLMVELSAEGPDAIRRLQLAAVPKDETSKALALAKVAEGLAPALAAGLAMTGVQTLPLAWGMVTEYADTVALKAYARVLSAYAVAVMRHEAGNPVVAVVTAQVETRGDKVPVCLRVTFLDDEDAPLSVVDFQDQPMLNLNTEVAVMLMDTLLDYGLADVDYDRRTYPMKEDDGRVFTGRPRYWQKGEPA